MARNLEMKLQELVKTPDPMLRKLQELQKAYVQQARVLCWVPPDLTNMVDRYQRKGKKINKQYLRAMIVHSLEECGGAAHPITISRYVHEMWPNLLKKDKGVTIYGYDDFVAAVKAELKDKHSGSFERIARNDPMSSYRLTAEELQRRKRSLTKWAHRGFPSERSYSADPQSCSDPLPQFLINKLHSEPSGQKDTELVAYVEANWKRNPHIEHPHYTLEQLVLLTLDADPSFSPYNKDPTRWRVSPPPATAQQNSLKGMTRGARQIDSGFRKPTEARRTRRRSSQERSNASPPPVTRSKKRHKSKETASSGSDWIQCDQCKKWLLAGDDGIVDLSLYDDNNPDHLDYYCPNCRESNAARNQPRKEDTTKQRRASAKHMSVESALDELEAELLQRYKREPNYWRNYIRVNPVISVASQACAELESQWRESLLHQKKHLVQHNVPESQALNRFQNFFYEQLEHLRESTMQQLKK